jgi:hypothetical protein
MSAIPWPEKSSPALAAIAAATAISAPGSRGANLCKRKTVATTDPARHDVANFALGRPWTICAT